MKMTIVVEEEVYKYLLHNYGLENISAHINEILRQEKFDKENKIKNEIIDASMDKEREDELVEWDRLSE